MLALIWMSVLIVLLVLYLRQAYSRFSRYDVKHLPTAPLVGNMGKSLRKQEHFVDGIKEAYKTFSNERFVGRYEFTNPMVIIRDLELLKKITVKDFDYFLNHRGFDGLGNEEYFARNLFFLRNDEWKDMRSTLSPAFTSSKIRQMLHFMLEVGDQMIKTLNNKIKETESGYIDVDVKDLTSRFATDVIASCAFGLKVDSHGDENNEFFRMGSSITKFGFKESITIFLMQSYPKLIEFIKIPIMNNEVKAFFRQLVLGTMHNREANNIIRPDMIHLLMQAKKGQLSHEEQKSDADAGFATVEESDIGKKQVNRVWSDHDLVAQAVLFFIAGFETVSTAMSFLFHELAIHPEIQERLAQEIKENHEKNNGKFDYNSIQNMTYLDMVISESVRLWPPVPVIDRQCTKDYNMGKPNDKATKDYIIHKGEILYYPIVSIHHNPDYYPDPLKFDPERFSEENKHNIKPYTYLPFFSDTFNNYRSRFALCEVKVMVYQLLQHFELSPAAKTQIPAKIDKSSRFTRIEGGHWVRFSTRK